MALTETWKVCLYFNYQVTNIRYSNMSFVYLVLSNGFLIICKIGSSEQY